MIDGHTQHTHTHTHTHAHSPSHCVLKSRMGRGGHTSYNDDQAGITNTLSTAATTNDATPGLNVGTGLTNPKLYVNGTEVAATYNATTGTLTPNTALTPDATYALSYSSETAAGVQTPKSAALNVTLDTTVLDPTMALATDSAGTSSSDGITNQSAVNVSGISSFSDQ